MKTFILATTFLIALSTTGWANNEVYLDQVGSGSTTTIDQLGSNNRVGQDRNNASRISGNAATVTVQQVGNNNTTNYNIIGDSNAYTSIVNGDSNDVTLNCGSQAPAGGNCTSSTIRHLVRPVILMVPRCTAPRRCAGTAASWSRICPHGR